MEEREKLLRKMVGEAVEELRRAVLAKIELLEKKVWALERIIARRKKQREGNR